MKFIKTLLITAIVVCCFATAKAQLPPPPPHPPLPHINLHIGTPPPPPRPPRIAIRSSGRGRVVVRRHYYYRHGVRHYRRY